MSENLATFFTQPMTITGVGRLAMLIPLTLSISIVYKTMRCERLSRVPAASVVLTIMILLSMGMIGLVLLVLFRLLA